ncbi:putative tyrosine-protein kinase YveL [Abditibacteriota bacterium]|nr:putative tyrosine-protein kinase YveL [Abditibacteriota bacterium]
MPSTIHQGEIVPAPGSIADAGRYPLPEESPPSEPTLSLRDFFGILRRRKLIAINVFVLVVVLGIAITLMTKPVYRTGARLLVEGRTNTFAFSNVSDPLNNVFQPKTGRDVDTQVEVLRSPLVLDRVYKQAGVAPGSVDLDVQRVDRTDVINLTVTSTSRDAAEQFTKALPNVYRDDMRRDRLHEVTASLNFARNTLQQQTAKLQGTERNLQNFKNRAHVVNTGDEATDAITQAATSRSDLAKAELDEARLQAQLDTLKGERSKTSSFTDNPVTTTNPQVQQLKDQLAGLLSERKQKLFLYQPTDDEIRKVDLQIADLQSRIAGTPDTITNTSRAPNPALAELDGKIGDVSAQLNASSKGLSALRRQVASQESGLGRFNNIQREEARLARDLENSTSAYRTLSQTVLQLTLRKTALEAADDPVTTMQAGGRAAQISPRMSRNLIAALFLGALLACGAALLQESLDDHLRDEEEARRLLGTSVLGYFPMLANKGMRAVLNMENPDKGLLESFRVLRSNVHFALINSPGQKLLVTSSVPGEGKSHIASNLAIAMAMNGRTVILVDTDLHRPRQHEIFGVSRYPGLTDALVGNAKLRDCVQEVGVPGMRLITAGVTPPNPAELLGSSVMDVVMDRLGKGADVVIFDSPPLLATSDSQVLSSKVDGVIFVMQLGRVPRSATKRSFELLRLARARVIGMVFNQIEEQSSKAYSGYGKYYYSDYADDVEDGSGNGHDGVATSLPKSEGTGALLTRARHFWNDPPTSSKGDFNGNGPHPNGPSTPDTNGDNRPL